MRRVTWMHGLALAGWMCGPVIAVVAIACGKSGAGPEGGNDGGTDGPADGPTDGGTDGNTDGGPNGLRCSQLLACDQVCTTNACTNGCYAESTGVAQGLFNALNDCINATCSSAAGGPCASASSSACSSCQTSAATGACVSNLLGCEEDPVVGPPDPDGGGVVVPPMDGGHELNCGGFIACVAACTGDGGACASSCTDQATPEARALAGVLNACLATACPSADGGVCATQGSACSGCVEQAELTLTDPCGSPFTACEADTSNSPDAGTSPTVLEDGGALSTVATGIGSPGALFVHGGYLYFTQVVTDSQVNRVPLADGGAVETVGPSQPTPVGLAVDSNNVYVWSVGTFSGASSLNNDDGTVVQFPLDGGAALTLAQHMEVEYDAPYLNSLAIDAKNVYWVEGASGNDGSVMWAPIGSATPQPLYTNQYLPEAIATDGTNVYWASWGTFDATGHSNNDGTISQGPVTGGTPMVLASNLSAPASIAIDANNVYWTCVGQLGSDNLPAPNTGSVMQVPIGGGTVITLASAQPIPLGIAVSGGTVYWTQYALSAPGLILSVPAGGGTVVPLVAGLPDPFSITVSGNTLYWSNSPSATGQGTILSLSPL
jgi:hypothetical protein